jgi:hypothetical protein
VAFNVFALLGSLLEGDPRARFKKPKLENARFEKRRFPHVPAKAVGKPKLALRILKVLHGGVAPLNQTVPL